MPNDTKPVTTNNQVPTTDDMPPVVMEDVIPPTLQASPIPIPVDDTQKPITPSDSGSAAPSNDVVMPPIITTQKKKFAGGKVIATILGLFLLVGGLGAGIFLVGQNQDIREQAGCYNTCMIELGDEDECNYSCGTNNTGGAGGGTVNPDCDTNQQGECIDNSDNSGDNGNTGDSGTGTNYGYGIFYCTAQQYAANGNTCDSSDVTNGTATQLSSVPNCFCGIIQNDMGTTQETTNGSCGCDEEPTDEQPQPTPPPGGETPTASCQNVKAYSPTWTLLTSTQLSSLATGSQVNFCVAGVATGGSFDKAKFTINSAVQAETTTVRPGSTDFCQLYTIPAGTTTFNVTAQIHHATLDWK